MMTVFVMASFSSRLPLHPLVQLEDGGHEDEQREAHREGHAEIVAVVEVDDAHVGGIGHDVVEGVGHGIVHPVHHDARYDAAGAVVHPSQEQAQTEGVGHLSGVHVDEGEEQGRHHDGHPVAAHAL